MPVWQRCCRHRRPSRYAFRFVDLFAGIGGIRSGFEAIRGQCVFTSEWNKHAVRTYKANWYCDPNQHRFNEDIRDITSAIARMSAMNKPRSTYSRDHSSPRCSAGRLSLPAFSLAGYRRKMPLGRHGFACETRGRCF
jgi:DNA (cytosine-5)-methyltransferase 1